MTAVALLATLGAACGGGGGHKAATSTATTAKAHAAFTYGTAPCPPATPPAQTPHSFANAPQRCTHDGVSYGAVIVTTEGTLTVDLLDRSAPGTVNNFVVLARWGWFNGNDFHRVVPGFVAQAGDRWGQPKGTGTPGYSIPDELPSSMSDYLKGTLAMANHGPDTGGSQWFVCYDCKSLPSPDYAIFAKVTGGMDVVDRINALGVGDAPPSKPVVITSVTITEH